MKKEILRLEGLGKRFGGVVGLAGVDLGMREGELLGVIGPNGSGKTTLVNAVTGFVRPDAGKVIYRDRDITGIPPYTIADLGIARTDLRQ